MENEVDEDNLIDEEQDNKPLFPDLGTLSKGLLIFGMIMLITYFLLYITTFSGSFEGGLEGRFAGNVDRFFCALPTAVMLLIAGGVLYIINGGFDAADEFDEE